MAAERRELDGILAHAERVEKLGWPLDFARRAWLNGRKVFLVANGPGPSLAGQAAEVVRQHEELSGLVSTGFCGALDPVLNPCDIFVATEVISSLPGGRGSVTTLPPGRGSVTGGSVSGKLLSLDHVVSTAAEKRELRKTGAAAVEMEAAAIAVRANAWSIPFYAIRVVTDTAGESFALDFNRMRDSDGRFSRAKILGAAFLKPGTVLPDLVKLNARSKRAARALGEFIASSQF